MVPESANNFFFKSEYLEDVFWKYNNIPLEEHRLEDFVLKGVETWKHPVWYIYAFEYRKVGDIGLFNTLVPNVLLIHFVFVDNSGDFL